MLFLKSLLGTTIFFISILFSAHCKDPCRIKKLSQTYFEDVCAAEALVTSTAADHELTFAEEFKIWAADAMLELLVKVNREVRVMLSKQVLRKCFRYLRLPSMEKIAKFVCSRKKMQNWLRIVCRYKSIEVLDNVHITSFNIFDHQMM